MAHAKSFVLLICYCIGVPKPSVGVDDCVRMCMCACVCASYSNLNTVVVVRPTTRDNSHRTAPHRTSSPMPTSAPAPVPNATLVTHPKQETVKFFRGQPSTKCNNNNYNKNDWQNNNNLQKVDGRDTLQSVVINYWGFHIV